MFEIHRKCKPKTIFTARLQPVFCLNTLNNNYTQKSYIDEGDVRKLMLLETINLVIYILLLLIIRKAGYIRSKLDCIVYAYIGKF